MSKVQQSVFFIDHRFFEVILFVWLSRAAIVAYRNMQGMDKAFLTCRRWRRRGGMPPHSFSLGVKSEEIIES